MRFFHLAPNLIAPGSVVLPGNFGRLILHPQRTHDPMYLREIAMEQYRAAVCPEKVSRLHCIFAFATLAATREFILSTQNFLGVLYEIEPLSRDVPIFYGCWRVGLIQDGALDLIELYWGGFRVDTFEAREVAKRVRVEPEDSVCEVMIGGEVRIVRRLDLDNYA